MILVLSGAKNVPKEAEDNFSYVYDFTDTSNLILVHSGPVHSRVCGDMSKTRSDCGST